MKYANNWYSIKARSAGTLEVSIHEEIGMFGVDAGEFIAQIRKHDDIKVINLSIHSPGGSMLDGLAIHNALKGHPASVNGHVDGVAASAASFVLMAADHISMPEDAFIMIHNATAMVMGDGDDMRDMADVLDKMQNTMLNIYTKRTGGDREDIAALMKQETWIGSEQAIELGFTDQVTDSIGVAAKLLGYERHFKQLPIECESDTVIIDGLDTVTEFGKHLRDAGGFSRKAADALVARARVILSGNPPEPLDETGIMLLEALDKVERQLSA